jgi:hypothetical protein
LGKKSVVCGTEGDAASALENGGASGWCSNVASGPTPGELLALVNAALVALDAGETEVASAQLRGLAETVRALRHSSGRDRVRRS